MNKRFQESAYHKEVIEDRERHLRASVAGGVQELMNKLWQVQDLP